MPILGLGTFEATEPGEIKRALTAAVKAGYRLIDCAANYGNQKEVGETLEEDEAKQLDKVWKEIDEDGSGELDVEEFIVLVTTLREMLNMKPLADAKARKQFKKLDKDGGGTLDQAEFKSFWKKHFKTLRLW